MTFWQENYAFIKDVYDMRHQKMAERMENVEKVRQEGIKKDHSERQYVRNTNNDNSVCHSARQQ